MKTVPLVLIHGFPFDHRMWSSVLKHLPPGIAAGTPDLPGFANSQVEPGSPGMEGYANFLARFLDSQGHQEVALAGTSMGGYVALAFAQKFPKRTRGIILVDSQATADALETIVKRKEQIQALRQGNLETVLSQLLPKLFSPSAVQFHAYARECAQAANPHGLIYALEAMAARPDRTDFLQNSSIPIAIIHAANDQVIPVNKSKDLAKSLPGSQWSEVPGGHASPMEAPAEVAQALKEFMEKLSPSGKLVSDTKQYRPGLVWSPSDTGL
jgi:pimeloyl-ACP methyl ester carboxylesterase